MAFRDFTFPEVQKALHLSLSEADLTSAVAPMTPREEFAGGIREGAEVAFAINTEKARSEFVIAPVLLELWRILKGTLGVYSGVEFNVDDARGLNGVCDFILTKSHRQSILTPPVVAILVANNDSTRHGFGQSIAVMVASQVFNQLAASPVATVYGVVSTGSVWKFLRVQKTEITVDIHEYYIHDLGKIMGVLRYLVQGNA